MRSACEDSCGETAEDSERLGFVDQHNGNAILHRIDQAAGVADQRLGRGAILERPLALGTDEYLQQLRSQSHENALMMKWRHGHPSRAPESRIFSAPFSSS